MDTTVFLVAVVAFAFAVTQLLPRFTGTTVRIGAAGHFALGVLVGPEVLKLVDRATLDQLYPLMSLLIGILGLSLGLEARGRLGALPRLPPRLLHALVVTGSAGAFAYAFLLLVTGGVVTQETLFWASATVGIMACASSWHRVVELAHQLRARGPVTAELEGYAMASLVIAVLLFGALTAGMRAIEVTEGARQLTTLEWLVATVGVGFGCGVLFMAVIGDEEAPPRVFLATVGTVIFATGVAAGLGISALLVNLVVGATVAAFSRHADRLQVVVGRLHQPAYVLLLILVGMVWQPPPLLLWLLVGVYILARYLGLRLGPAAAFAAAETPLPTRRFGEGLLAQGAFALAIATNFLQLRAADGSLLVTVAVAAILVEDFLADRRLRRVLADAEELFQAPEPQELPPSPPAAAEVHA